MAIHPNCIKKPASPVSRSFVPAGGKPYKVKDGDSWVSLAAAKGMDPWTLIRFNYPGLPAANGQAALEVNWYLQEYVGCVKLTSDNKNYCFSSAATPGIVYLPDSAAPKTCTDDLGNVCSHKVRLHFKSIGTPTIPEFTALKNMQAVYGQYGIKIEFASGESLLLSKEQQVSLINVDVGTCTLGGKLTDEQEELFNLGSFQAVRGTDIVIYYVEAVRPDSGSLVGCATHAKGRPTCIVASRGSKWTLAHEVSHVLGLTHLADTTNIMNTPTASITSNPPGLTEDQLKTVKKSTLVVAC
ncbi:MAG: hypothetical protein SFV51_06310 [Bryobacteraceae bacterium]|nr:hypothetical protein [Bryobacteraceae bacterium]